MARARRRDDARSGRRNRRFDRTKEQPTASILILPPRLPVAYKSFTQWWVRLNTPHTQKFGHSHAAIADILTQEGHRSVRRSHVPARTVQLVRQRRGVPQNAMATRARHISGWLTIDKVAEYLQVSTSWIKRRIRNGTITVQRDPRDNRYLFPDTPDGISALQELKSGARDHLVIDPRPNK